MRFESIIQIDNENAKDNLELWKHHFIKQKQNTTGTFDVFKEKYTYSESQGGKKKIHKKIKKGFLRL